MSKPERDKIEVKCVICGNLFYVAQSTFRRYYKNGNYLCQSCAAKRSPKPQNTKDYWDEKRCEQHGNLIKASERYYEGIKNRDNSGSNNPMFGKKASIETRKLMSKSRTGKLGPNATAWKGGKQSLICRVKKIIHTRFNWYSKVYKRDNWTCQYCGSQKNLDAHHIVPVSVLIPMLIKDKAFISVEAKIEWLVSQPEIADLELRNGVTLCRTCHKRVHINWGSHKPYYE
jgi:hypothetical protein